MKIVFSALAILALLGGCAKNLSSDEYSEADAGGAVKTYRGTVVSVRKVRIKGGDRLQDNSLGMIGGGVGGAIIGSQFGKGTGSTIGTLLGAAAGAVGGSFAEQGLKTQDALEYTVQLENNSIMTIVQGMGAPLAIGQSVFVMVNRSGRSRVVIDQTVQKPNKSKAPAAKKTSRTIVVIED